MYRFLFKKVAQFHLRIWLPVISGFYNWYYKKKLGTDVYHQAIMEREKLTSMQNFLNIKQHIQGKYKWTADPAGGAIDWVPSIDTLIMKNWKDDCDAFATCVREILTKAHLLASSKVVTILPTQFKNFKRMHVVADVTLKGAPDIHIILSSGYFYEMTLNDYIKETYKDCGSDVMVLDYYSGKEV